MTKQIMKMDQVSTNLLKLQRKIILILHNMENFIHLYRLLKRDIIG